MANLDPSIHRHLTRYVEYNMNGHIVPCDCQEHPVFSQSLTYTSPLVVIINCSETPSHVDTVV